MNITDLKNGALLAASTNGLSVYSLKTRGFIVSEVKDKQFYYNVNEFLTPEAFTAWLDLVQDQPGITAEEVLTVLQQRGLIGPGVPLSQEAQTELGWYSEGSAAIENRGYNAEMPSWIESAVYLRKLNALCQANSWGNNTINYWYFPLSSSTSWYKGVSGQDLQLELTPTAAYSEIYSHKTAELADLIIDQAISPFEVSSNWPMPLRPKVLKTWQGLRPSHNKVTNLVSRLQGHWDNGNTITLPMTASPESNPAQADYTGLLAYSAANQSFNISIAELLPEGTTLEVGKSYTISLYARYKEKALTGAKVTFFLSDQVKLEYPLQDAWKRYYTTFAWTSEYQEATARISFTSETATTEVKLTGIQLEQTDFPSPYIPDSYKTSQEEQDSNLWLYPLLYQLPIPRVGSVSVADNAQLSYKAGTLIYRKYIEDNPSPGLNPGDHFDSLGLSDAAYVVWGIDHQTGLPVIKTTGSTDSSANTTQGSFNSGITWVQWPSCWLTYIVTFDFTSASNNIIWYVYKGPETCLCKVTASIDCTDWTYPLTCHTQANRYHTGQSKSVLRFNVALGSELKQGIIPVPQTSDPDPADPYDRLFRTNETEIGLPDGSIFQDLTYTNKVLTEQEIASLMLDVMYLKEHSNPADPYELGLVGSPLKQSPSLRADLKN